MHYAGATAHFLYVVTLTAYIANRFLVDGQYGKVDDEGYTDHLYAGLMCVGIAYPWAYDTIQLCRSGLEYFKDAWNWTDIVFQYSGIVNIAY